MKVSNPRELVGKEVVDRNGSTIGTIDKTWNSWNQEYPGYFFGIRPNEDTRDKWFRGTNKLIPIYSNYVLELGERITLNKTAEELGHFWNKTINCDTATYPTEELLEKAIYDRNYSRVGTLYGWVESDGTYRNYGCFVDPYLCDTWKIPYNTLMPMPTNLMYHVRDTILVDKTLDELKEYWHKQYTL